MYGSDDFTFGFIKHFVKTMLNFGKIACRNRWNTKRCPDDKTVFKILKVCKIDSILKLVKRYVVFNYPSKQFLFPKTFWQR